MPQPPDSPRLHSIVLLCGYPVPNRRRPERRHMMERRRSHQRRPGPGEWELALDQALAALVAEGWIELTDKARIGRTGEPQPVYRRTEKACQWIAEHPGAPVC